VTSSLEGKTALVTGAAQGIGRAIAARLHASGANVYLLDIDGGGARAAAEELGERALSLAADVRDRSHFEAAHATVLEQHGGVDVLVNNAARTVNRSVWEIEQEDWDDVLATNLRSVLFASQIAGASMRDRRSGRIVNLTSLAGQQGGLVAGAHYAASKAGIIVLTKIFARELAPYGVTVNAVAPAAIDGPIMQSLGTERIEALAGSIPVGRIGRPDEVAAAVAYLASDSAGFVTGATLDVNGGVSMR
jgi:3-oxoacyl-[acyl-carrier protein] reductase